MTNKTETTAAQKALAAIAAIENTPKLQAALDAIVKAGERSMASTDPDMSLSTIVPKHLIRQGRSVLNSIKPPLGKS